MKQQNKWEKLFDEFLDLTEFELIKHRPNDYEYDPACWSLKDKQGANLGDIEYDRFINAEGILDRMEIYINDYIIESLEQGFHNSGINYEELDIYGAYFEDLLQHRNALSDDYSWDFDVLDMICNHFKEINLENCTYEEE